MLHLSNKPILALLDENICYLMPSGHVHGCHMLLSQKRLRSSLRYILQIYYLIPKLTNLRDTPYDESFIDKACLWYKKMQTLEL